MIDREPRRSGAPDDQQALPHRGGTRRTEDPGRCSDAPSSPVSDAKYRQKTESVFAKTFKSLLQQNRHLADKPTAPIFVAYRTNNGQRLALGTDGSAAIDPKQTLAVHCRNGLMPVSAPIKVLV